jgi:hypothetical protein
MRGGRRPGRREQLEERDARVRGRGVEVQLEHGGQRAGGQRRRQPREFVEGEAARWLGMRQDD